MHFGCISIGGVMKLRFSMAFHSQTVGKTEHVNGIFNQYLRILVVRTNEIGRTMWVCGLVVL
jgi:hypothetical protein